MVLSGTQKTIAAALLGIVAALAVPGTGAADVQWTPGGIRVSYSAPGAGAVQIAGSFNNWTGEPMDREDDGTWSKVLHLGAGLHEYKFVVDGEWIADPDNPVSTGEFGNSAFNLGEDGRLAAMEATSNTDYSEKILITGRTIGIYLSRKDPEEGDRFELRRPTFDTDVAFGVRMNDVLDARILTNINNESEVDAVQSFRTRLNFDRGWMHFKTTDLEGWAWDNDAVQDWGDPLQLVGGVGIYDHSFGFNTQGLQLAHALGPVQIKLIYADNFEAGGQTPPSLGFPFTDDLAPSSGIVPSETDGLFQLGTAGAYGFTKTSADEDVAAVRGTTEWNNFSFGVSGRLDRNFNPAVLGQVDGVRADTLALEMDFGLGGGRVDTLNVAGFSGDRQRFTRFSSERWWAAGLDVAGTDVWEDVDVRLEALYGRSDFVGRFGEQDVIFFGTVPDTVVLPDTTLVFAEPELVAIDGLSDSITDPTRRTGPTTLDTKDFEIDQSWRFHVGFADLPEVLGVGMNTSLELETHRYAKLLSLAGSEIENRVWTWNAQVERPSELAGRRFDPSLGIEFHYFDLETDTPWSLQPWFDVRNFWLESGETDVSFERLTLLGGMDALILRPSLRAEISRRPNVLFEYDGTIAGPGFGNEPSYVETITRGRWRITPRWSFLLDVRFAKYNQRLLDLNDSFNETFWELSYEVAEDVVLAFSYGVDPWVIDPPVNEYDYIGRDAFLFARGADARTAELDYIGLRDRILAAESALANERALQVEAIVRF